MKITSSENKVTFDKIGDVMTDKEIAAATEAVMDKQFIEQSRHDWCWLGGEQIPTEVGWYKIDRENQQLIKILHTQASELEWHERLFIYQSAITAAKEHTPLAMYIGDEYTDGRLSALYLCGPDVLTWVAQKEVL